MTDPGVPHFLAALRAGTDVERAWAEFLEQWSPLLLKVAWRFSADRDDALDFYLHLLERLSENRHRRLLAFRSGGTREFAAWLSAVARNLCVDRLRGEVGRRRLPRSVARLDAVARDIFEAVYWDGLSPSEAVGRASARNPSVPWSRLLDAAEEVELCLRPWQFAELARTARGNDTPGPLEGGPAIPDPAATPEQELLGRQELAALERAIATLAPDDRLLLRLRFEQGLTLARCASVLGIDDYRKAFDRLGRIFATLREALEPPPSTKNGPVVRS